MVEITHCGSPTADWLNHSGAKPIAADALGGGGTLTPPLVTADPGAAGAATDERTSTGKSPPASVLEP